MQADLSAGGAKSPGKERTNVLKTGCAFEPPGEHLKLLMLRSQPRAQ